MKRDPRALANGEYDVFVIGGGIFGAGVARDAALRGLRVALAEQGDFASATSSRSSKLIHGGFRYLEQRAFGLVRESCRERAILLQTAPHLVHATPFLMPVYEGSPRSLMTMRVGMRLYDWLSPAGSLPRHVSLSPDQLRMKEPALDGRGLRGGLLYRDCQEDDARLCLDTLLHAVDHGAICVNYCRVTKLETHGDRVVAARVVDAQGGGEQEIRAKVFVNAAGPWVEQVCNLASLRGPSVRLQPTKGVHLLLPRLTQAHAITLQAKRDGRIMFMLPWQDCSLVGTTDTDFSGDPGDVRADAEDIDYLLGEVNRLLPGANVSAADVITSFAGVRSLVASDTRSPSARSREQVIARHGQNLISIAGGKYTTYRAIAEDVTNRICDVLGIKAPCVTATTMIPSRVTQSEGPRLADYPAVFVSDVRRACTE
jgi:glycerol-3-phosphate dehydrogenase